MCVLFRCGSCTCSVHASHVSLLLDALVFSASNWTPTQVLTFDDFWSISTCFSLQMLQFFSPKFWPCQSLMGKTSEVCFSTYFANQNQNLKQSWLEIHYLPRYQISGLWLSMSVWDWNVRPGHSRLGLAKLLYVYTEQQVDGCYKEQRELTKWTWVAFWFPENDIVYANMKHRHCLSSLAWAPVNQG